MFPYTCLTQVMKDIIAHKNSQTLVLTELKCVYSTFTQVNWHKEPFHDRVFVK